MATPEEPDFPLGHPKRFDYNPKSPEARRWADRNIHPAGERDFPVGHPKALDTKGNTNSTPVRAGIDPQHPELEPFSGRTPEQVAADEELWNERKRLAQPSPELEPGHAPDPPTRPGDTRPPSGQPGETAASDQTLRDRIRQLLG
jgi:hypothetical protein